LINCFLVFYVFAVLIATAITRSKKSTSFHISFFLGLVGLAIIIYFSFFKIGRNLNLFPECLGYSVITISFISEKFLFCDGLFFLVKKFLKINYQIEWKNIKIFNLYLNLFRLILIIFLVLILGILSKID
jgi:hypothetical protein